MFKTIAKHTTRTILTAVVAITLIVILANSLGFTISVNSEFLPDCENDTDLTITSAKHVTYEYEQVVPGIGIQTVTTLKLFGDSTQVGFYCQTF